MDDNYLDMFSHKKKSTETECISCREKSVIISDYLGLCVNCIRNDFNKISTHIRKLHSRSREEFDLPVEIPNSPEGVPCNFCSNKCRLTEGETGYCGIRKNTNGLLVGGDIHNGLVEWYQDPIPTNCVAEWVCPATTDAGFPRYTHVQGTEFECSNLAVFYRACNFNCLFCQNWNFRETYKRPITMTSQDLADRVEKNTTCVCFFGGDPTPQVAHAIEAARIIQAKKRDLSPRICWETNGAMNPAFLKQMIDLSMESGGCIKFDLKAWSRELNIALCGVSNERTLSNFEMAVNETKSRPDPPPVIASTLLVPGYIDDKEIIGLSRFIASLDPGIPYTLLGFHPEFYMDDLPSTSREFAERAYSLAKDAGLQRVKLGNIHTMGHSY